MPSDAIMRDKVKSVYPNKSWAARVNGMNHNQVLAIYRRFEQQGAFKERRTHEPASR